MFPSQEHLPRSGSTRVLIHHDADQPRRWIRAEDEWVGSVLQIGDAVVRVDARDSRCIVVNVNPDSGRPDAALLKLLGQHRQSRAGVYGTVVRPGLAHLDDPVWLVSRR